MGTTIHNIDQVTCSLYVGDKAYIYAFDYAYTPMDGTKITIDFVCQDGVYNVPQIVNSNSNANILSVAQKVQITIGGAAFSMYALSYSFDSNVNRKILKVNFVDDTFRLDNYHVVLTGEGCGERVFPLGVPVDPRTDRERVAESLDKTVQHIRNQATSTDIEYRFSDFVAILQLIFSITITGTWDHTVTKPFVGTFRTVLEDWCRYLNLIYYFEEGLLVISNPQSLNITFPPVPTDALNVTQSESLENTFTATSSVVFKQDGGQFGDNGPVATELASTSGPNGNIITNLGLFPIGSEFGLQQTPVDLNQVAAASYGQQYWFLYNYMQGTTEAECGWTRISYNEIPTSSLKTSIEKLLTPGAGSSPAPVSGQSSKGPGGIAYINETIFNQRYEMYKQYGIEIAGRYYLSNEQQGSIYAQQTFSWFNQTDNVIFDIQGLLAGKAGNSLGSQISYFFGGTSPSGGYIEGTEINKYFLGIFANGNRIVYRDNRVVDLDTVFKLTAQQTNLINTYFQNLTIGLEGSNAMDYTQISSKGDNLRYVVFDDQIINTTQNNVPSITQVQELAKTFQPARAALNILGVKQATLIQSNAANGTNDIITKKTDQDVTNTNTLTTLANPIANIYFNKLNACFSQSSLDQAGLRGAYGHKFNPRQLSPDTPILFSVNKTSPNSYTVLRNLTYLQNAIAPSVLAKTCLSQLQSLKRISFSTNYFIPTLPRSNFITNGLTALSVSISSDGLEASYEFSNAMLYIPNIESFFDKLARNMRNSWIRQYNPQQNVS